VRADIAVVGAGIVGCMIAREILDRAPAATVVVLDRGTVGGGASRLSAGLHLPRGSTPRVRAMTAYSHDFYLKLHAERPDLPIHPVAMTVVADGAARPPEAYLDRAELTRGPTGWDGESAHYTDVYALTQALASELRPRVTFREGVRVATPGTDLYLSTGEVLGADRVVLAPGPWLPDLTAPLGLRVKKIVALHIERPPGPDDRLLVFHDEDAFLLPLRERGHWLFSFTSQDWDVDPDTVGAGLSPHDLDDARACLRRYLPELAEAASSGRVFCDAYSPTGEPCVRALDQAGRIVFAGAANGSGYRLAPAIASEAADLLHLGSYA
jgi:glycine/D-amino acid oxidase-like deaminating enzyme